jgi:putative endonuclease
MRIALAFNRQFYVYILSSKSRHTYVGMTNSLFTRVMQHKAGEVEFTSRYRINRLVYYEIFKYVNNCIARETQIKAWSRAKKVALIESMNPIWEDLAANYGKPIKPLKPKTAR